MLPSDGRESLPNSVKVQNYFTGVGSLGRMRSPIGDFIGRRLATLGLNRHQFSLAVRENPGYVHQVLEGKTLASEKMPAWATALKLTGSEREYFYEVCAVQHLPEANQRNFLRYVNRQYAQVLKQLGLDDLMSAERIEAETSRLIADGPQSTARAKPEPARQKKPRG